MSQRVSDPTQLVADLRAVVAGWRAAAAVVASSREATVRQRSWRRALEVCAESVEETLDENLEEMDE